MDRYENIYLQYSILKTCLKVKRQSRKHVLNKFLEDIQRWIEAVSDEKIQLIKEFLSVFLFQTE